jgi:ribosome modulation factor
MTNLSLQEGAQILHDFKAKRAFDLGYKARLEGKPKEAIPPDMHIFSAKWLEGWWSADTDMMPVPDQLLLGSIQHVRNVLTLPAMNILPEVEIMSA